MTKSDSVWFGSLIRQIDLDVDIESLIKFSYDIKDLFPSSKIGSIDAGYQSPDLEENYDVLQPLKNKILDNCNNLHEMYQLKKDCVQVISNIWININPKGGINTPHNHPGSIFSGVFHLQCNENSGDLCFTHPAVNQNYHFDIYSIETNNNLNSGGVTFTPEASKLTIFPGYQNHYVKPNASDEDRISIAFNTKLAYK